MKIEIINRLTAKLIFEVDAETIKIAVQTAITQKVSLTAAYLRGAYLSGADLRGALISADLKLANSPRPIFYSGPLGSDADELLAFLTEKGIYIRRGCFLGTLPEFRAAVEKNHAENEHGQEYAAALEMIELHFKFYPATK